MWWAVSVSPVLRADVDRVTARLFALGASGVQEDPVPELRTAPVQPWDVGEPVAAARVVLTGSFECDDVAPVVAAVRAAVRGAEVTAAPIEERDWEAEYRATVVPLRIGRIAIVPPWAPEPGAVVLEPGLGFGTGDHPTTRQVLARLDLAVGPDVRTCLDVGSGSGILALAAARLGVPDVLGVDVEASAVLEARRNAEVNGLPARFAQTPVSALDGPYDLVLANLHAELVAQLAPHLLRLTGRRLILAGILADREARVRASLGLDPAARGQDGEWVWWEIVR